MTRTNLVISERFDSVRGTRDGWTRQIAFVKDADPLGDNFFVMSDTLREPAPMKWQLWLTANRVVTQPRSALVEGQEDVDLDIVFTAPNELTLRTEEKTRTCLGLMPDGAVRTNLQTTQTGPLADGNAIRVRSESGTSYVFLSPTPFTFREADLTFEGTSGLIQLHGDTLVLSLGSSGRIAARGHELREEHATQKTWNLK